MSKIGKKPIVIPEGIEVKITDGVLEFSAKGKKDVLKVNMLPNVEVKNEEGKLVFSIKNDKNIQTRANWGTIRALAQNAIVGLMEGYKKILDLQGVGFRATMEGKTLVLNIGFSHPIKVNIPEGLLVSVEKNTAVTISGIDKGLVGEVAAKIRAMKKPNPYLGTGIRYRDEVIKKKAGKKAAAAAGGAA
ncbi:MAG: 50S ribosomal protein L6 [Candidatus Pacebacteria bacterium]|nr:50S ribosomal protein L6 [Candidatus Paceibacterota bacterium]